LPKGGTGSSRKCPSSPSSLLLLLPLPARHGDDHARRRRTGERAAARAAKTSRLICGHAARLRSAKTYAIPFRKRLCRLFRQQARMLPHRQSGQRTVRTRQRCRPPMLAVIPSYRRRARAPIFLRGTPAARQRAARSGCRAPSARRRVVRRAARYARSAGVHRPCFLPSRLPGGMEA